MTNLVNRELLGMAFPGNIRLQRAFEEQAQTVETSLEGITQAVEATVALEDATFLTLSDNASLKNERVLSLGRGLMGDIKGGAFTISTTLSVPLVTEGFTVNFTVSGDSNVLLPISGRVATMENPETFKRKSLDAPKIIGLVNAVDDAAAAASGVPVTGVYRNGSILMVRVS